MTNANDPSSRPVDQSAAWRRLVESEARYRTIAEHATDLVWEVDPDGVLVWVSPSFESRLGWRPDQLIGTPSVDLVAEADLPTVIAGRTHSLQHGSVDRVEFRMRTASGTLRWVAARTHRVSDAAGRMIGAVISATDIEAVMQARHALQDAEHRFRVLAQNSAEVIAEAREGRITWISESVTPLLGWRPEDLVGRAVFDLLHPDDIAAYRDELAQTVYTPRQYTGRVRTADGGWHWITSRFTDAFDREGEPFRAASWRDVDLELRALMELQAASDRLRATVDSMLDPHVVLRALRDDHGEVVDFEYTDANPASCIWNAASRDELVGSRVLDRYPGAISSGLFDLYVKTLGTDLPLVLDGYPFPDPRFDASRRFDIRGVRISATSDEISFTWRDVTDRYAD